MVMVNRVLLAGNLAADPELRAAPSGAAVCEFTLAVNRAYTHRQTQQRVEETSFVEVVAWGRTAEVCGEFLKKGNPALVEGRLTQSRWESAEGKKLSRLRVTAESVQFLGGRKRPDGSESDGPGGIPSDPEAQTLFG